MSFHNTIITGSKGFIGHNLIKNLSHNIVPIENSKQSLNLPNIIDLNKQYNIICCGAYILKSNTSIYDPIKSIIDNILNSFISIYNIRYNISHICFLSTADVYKQPNEIPIIENHPIQPTTYYATSKLCLENYLKIFCQECNIPLCILRLGHVYGKNDNSGKIIYKIIDNAKNNFDIILYNNGQDIRNYIYIDDVTNIIQYISMNQINGIYNLISNQNISIEQLAKIIIKLTNSKSKILYKNENKPSLKLIFDNQKLQQIYNFTFTSIENGIYELL